MTNRDPDKRDRRRIYLVRHGEVSYFDSDGRPVDPRSASLTREGEAQARALAQVLAGIPFDRAVCSGVKRTKRTAELIVSSRDLEIEDEPAFMEIRGSRFAEIPSGLAEMEIAYPYDKAGNAGALFIRREAFEDFERRILAAFHTLISHAAWRRLLIVAHDAVNRVLLCWAAGIDRRAMAAFEQDPGCLNVIDLDFLGDTFSRRFIRAVNLTPLNLGKDAIWTTSMEPVFAGYLAAREKGYL